MLGITLRQLETFVAVAETGGFRRGAERLNLSQSAVTTHIQSLEAQLGVVLFHRTTRSVRLTRAGDSLLAQAARTLSGLEETVRRFQDEASVRRGRVTLATAPSFASSLLPGILAAFNRHHPDIVVQVVEAYGPDIIEAVRSHAADFGFGPMDQTPHEFTFNHLLTDNLTAIVSDDHPLAGAGSITLGELAGLPLLVMPRLSETRLMLEAAFADRNLALEPAYEMLHHQTLIALAEAGVGVGVLPSLSLRGAGRGLCRSLIITDPEITRKVGTITIRGQSLSPAAAALSGDIFDNLSANRQPD